MNFSVASDGGASEEFILLSIGSTKNLPENFPSVIPLKLEVSDQAGVIPTTTHEFDLNLTPNCEPDDLNLGQTQTVDKTQVIIGKDVVCTPELKHDWFYPNDEDKFYCQDDITTIKLVLKGEEEQTLAMLSDQSEDKT